MASWISTAATAESTPPERPQITRPLPTCARMRSDRLLPEGPHGPVAAAAGDVAHEVADQQRAVRRMHDLRVELHAVELPALVGDDREGRVRRDRERLEAVRAAWSPGRRGSSRPGSSRPRARRP